MAEDSELNTALRELDREFEVSEPHFTLALYLLFLFVNR